MPSYLSVILFEFTTTITNVNGIRALKKWNKSNITHHRQTFHNCLKTQYQYLAQRSFAKCSLDLRSLDNRSLVRLLRSACPATHPCPRACASCCIYLWPPRHPNTYVSSLFFSPYISIPPAPRSYFFSGLNSKSCQEAQRPACAWSDISLTWVFEQCWAMLGNDGQCWVISGNFG